MFKVIKIVFFLYVVLVTIHVFTKESGPSNVPNTDVKNCQSTVRHKVSSIIKRGLKVRSSFKHIRTSIIAPDGPGSYLWVMNYQAQNVFGVPLTKRATGTVSVANCDIVISAYEV